MGRNRSEYSPLRLSCAPIQLHTTIITTLWVSTVYMYKCVQLIYMQIQRQPRQLPLGRSHGSLSVSMFTPESLLSESLFELPVYCSKSSSSGHFHVSTCFTKSIAFPSYSVS